MNNSIYPCLTLKGQVVEAADFYTAIFGEARVLQTSNFVIQIELSGQKFMLLNDGPTARPNASISFMVFVDDEEQLEEYWKSLVAGGEVLMAIGKYEWSKRYGWVQDKFGVSWQLYLSENGTGIQRFCPTLMFTGHKAGLAKKAVEFYTSVFPQSNITGIMNYEEKDADKTDLVKHAQFELNNYVMMAMDSSAEQGSAFNEAISIVVECETQDEIDLYWTRLTADSGYEVACGWLTDQFGVSWQIIPKSLGKLISDPERGQCAMAALLKMKKLVIHDLETA